jgi:plastocyanin
MRLRIAGMTLAGVLAMPAAASADATVLAVDGTAANAGVNQWAPSTATVKVGEKVTWRFDGTTVKHNVKSDAGGWFIQSPLAIAGQPAEYAFATPGTYAFYCEAHRSTMSGTITVTDATGAPPPPPPPPPLSEQPFANDVPAPATLEVRDTVAPKLDRVRVTRVRKGAKVRLRLSEAGKVVVKLTRGKTVKRRTAEVAKGTSSFTVAGLRAGTYRVDVSATDLAGNAAKRAMRARVTVRR